MKTRNTLKTSALFALLALCGPLFSQVLAFGWQGAQREILIKIPEGLYFIKDEKDATQKLLLTK